MNPTVKILALVGLLSAFVGACVWLGLALRGYVDRLPLPPATRHAIDRATKANRADLSAVRPLQIPPPGRVVRFREREQPDLAPVALDHFDHGGTEP